MKWPKQSQCAAFYGNPDANRDGRADRKWETENLVRITPPYPLYYPKEEGKKLIRRGTAFRALNIHKKCAESLIRALAAIRDTMSVDDIRKYELDICGGTYVFRLMRNGRAMSMHSYGCAIDLSHLLNPYKRKYKPDGLMMPPAARAAFEAEGWVWGGRWSTPDPMHFQAAEV